MGTLAGSLSSFFLGLPMVFKGPFLYVFLGAGFALAVLLLLVYLRGLRRPRK